MQQDKSVDYRKRDEGHLGDFGDESPRNSFSGGERDHLFLNRKGEQFYDLDLLSGLAHPGDGRTLCQLDYDRDGWIDFVVASANAPTIQLYRNRLGETARAGEIGADMIALRFVGGNRSAQASPDWSARDGYGALATIDVGEKPLIREYRCGDGRAGQNSSTMIVGIGTAPSVRALEVRWPSGRIQSTAEIPAGSRVDVYENPEQSPTGEAFVVEPYKLDVLAGAAPPVATAEELRLSLPAGDDRPRLNVLTAMSTTCASCKKAQPQVALLRKTFTAAEVGLYGVGTDLAETERELRDYVDKYQPFYEVLAALPAAERTAVRDHVIATYQDDLTPVTIVTDPSGRILETMTGVPSVSDLRRLLERR